jgi:hypothetical protein
MASPRRACRPADRAGPPSPDEAQVQDIWRIDDEWWREEVSRLYYRLRLEDERRVTIYNDLISLDWHQQEY